MIGRYELMVLHLLGEAVPAPPEMPGRSFIDLAPGLADPGLQEFEAAALWRALARECDADLQAETR